MNFNQCVIFYHVCRELNFTKAAKKLFITQSAVSHAMKELENEAGYPLIERLHRGVKITPAGLEFYHSVIPLIEDFNKLNQQLPRLAKKVPMKIAACMTFAENDLATFIQGLSQQGILTEVQIAKADEVLSLLENGEADLIFLEGPAPSGTFLQKEIKSYSLGFFTNQAVAQKLPAKMKLANILQENLLVRERGSAVRELLEAALVLNHLALHPSWQSNDSAGLIAAAKAGLGIAFLPKVLVETSDLVEIKVTDLALENPVIALMRKTAENSPVYQVWKNL
ncbi:LysR family transcriptional regulator [Enterococcus alishanensis]|uniref:LysR family transcriptional regulator n=1 Tax=Enterococcus alishanensis TaxID=1303817 RepID=A0ABS6TFM4_9ENTE|nr:LysR family transcriptional regulator [Enterococcus alishanensis]MBV7391709.1 LysR family transcriptional regulator [Enterococcus alishanensis]